MKHSLCRLLGAVLCLGMSGQLALAQKADLPAQKTIVPFTENTNQQVRYRKNIDDLSPAELAAYEHAVKMMKRKSEQNVFDRTGFLWQAWVHNCGALDVFDQRTASLSEVKLTKLLANPKLDSCNVRNFLNVPNNTRMHTEHPGECEHQKNTFLHWHRAELYFYELSLQAADPEGLFGPSTRNVTLPYWNFTKKPSGVRYPKAFENTESPLFDFTRTTDPLVQNLPQTSPYLMAYQIFYLDWSGFGGGQLGTTIGGKLETQIHNKMHSGYVNGNMGNNTTAGLDPIFYVFHNFLDYSLDKWIQEHGTEQMSSSSLSTYLRGEQDDSLRKPPGFNTGSGAEKRTDSGAYTENMGPAGIYLNTIKLGYGFQSQNGDEFIRRDEIQALIDGHAQAGYVFGDNQISLFSALLNHSTSEAIANPQIKRTGKYTIPGTTITGSSFANLIFSRIDHSKDYSFQADVYLYPGDVAEAIADKNFRDRYLITSTAYWALHGHHAHDNVEFKEQITGIINSLVSQKQGQEWRVTVAISAAPGAPVEQSDFSVPTIELGIKSAK
ncbi:tyrosinase family protein [Undibacterium sp. CY7W]|uniref:Tyrosinase family protein n=1 Tax=Undibacterium rugosum TaxID=2762291 RepID=A0A923I5A5_9BURK|nr:tyrosinase family protein [Undibacterium rugosum]MBC3936625.1 tyrosinase family protein [Undibacterium rugosum]